MSWPYTYYGANVSANETGTIAPNQNMKTVTFHNGRISVVCPEPAVRAVVVKQSSSSAIVQIGEVTFTMTIDEAKLFEDNPRDLSFEDRQIKLMSAIYNGSSVHVIPVTSIKSGEGGGAGGATSVGAPTPPTPTPEAPGIS